MASAPLYLPLQHPTTLATTQNFHPYSIGEPLSRQASINTHWRQIGNLRRSLRRVRHRIEIRHQICKNEAEAKPTAKLVRGIHVSRRCPKNPIKRLKATAKKQEWPVKDVEESSGGEDGDTARSGTNGLSSSSLDRRLPLETLTIQLQPFLQPLPQSRIRRQESRFLEKTADSRNVSERPEIPLAMATTTLESLEDDPSSNLKSDENRQRSHKTPQTNSHLLLSRLERLLNDGTSMPPSPDCESEEDPSDRCPFCQQPTVPAKLGIRRRQGIGASSASSSLKPTSGTSQFWPSRRPSSSTTPEPSSPGQLELEVPYLRPLSDLRTSPANTLEDLVEDNFSSTDTETTKSSKSSTTGTPIIRKRASIFAATFRDYLRYGKTLDPHSMSSSFRESVCTFFATYRLHFERDCANNIRKTMGFGLLEELYQRRYIPPLIPMLEEGILFLVRDLSPHLLSLEAKKGNYYTKNSHGLINGPRKSTVNVYLLVFGPYLDILRHIDNPFMRERWRSRTLRKGQINLIYTAFWYMNRGLEGVMRNGGDVRDLKRVILGYSSIIDFLTCKRFRSERLEILLTRYLQEWGLNRKVVRDVERKTAKFEVAIAMGQVERREVGPLEQIVRNRFH